MSPAPGSVPIASPTSGATASPLPGSSSPTPGTLPTPVPNPGPSTTPVSTTVTLADGSKLILSLPTQFLSLSGQTVRIQAKILDPSGKAVSLETLKLLFSSSQPNQFSVDQNGLVTALVSSGSSTITVKVDGTQITATLQVSVSAQSSGGGGGGGGSTGGNTGTGNTGSNALTQLNLNIGFDGLGLGRFGVNTYTVGNQYQPKAASDTAGNFVVVWAQDGAQDGIYAQRYNFLGVALGDEFRVNTTTSGNRRQPSVAMDYDGDFVISWTSLNQAGGTNDDIYAQRYHRSGIAQGSEFRVNNYTASNQDDSAIAMDSDGDFVITWTSYEQDESGHGVYAKRFNASGENQGDEFPVNTFTENYQGNSRIAMDQDGDFVIAWEGRGLSGDYSTDVYARRFNASAVAAEPEFRANTIAEGYQGDVEIAMNSAGSFVLTWQSPNQDSTALDAVYARRFDSQAQALASEFRVNTGTTGDHKNPAIAMDKAGSFIVSWETVSPRYIKVQRYSAAGLKQGESFSPHPHDEKSNVDSALTLNSAGDFVLIWDGKQQDGSGSGIFAKRYNANGIAK